MDRRRAGSLWVRRAPPALRPARTRPRRSEPARGTSCARTVATVGGALPRPTAWRGPGPSEAPPQPALSCRDAGPRGSGRRPPRGARTARGEPRGCRFRHPLHSCGLGARRHVVPLAWTWQPARRSARRSEPGGTASTAPRAGSRPAPPRRRAQAARAGRARVHRRGCDRRVRAAARQLLPPTSRGCSSTGRVGARHRSAPARRLRGPPQARHARSRPGRECGRAPSAAA